MGRTGGAGTHGGGGGSHSSHSGGSHSHSSHSFGGSSRSSFSGSSSSKRGIHTSSRSGYSSPPRGHMPPPVRRRRWYGYGPTRTVVHHYGGFSLTRLLSSIIAVMLIFFILVSVFSGMRGDKEVVSTVNRERITGSSFTEDCIVDELGWIREDGSTAQKVGRSLEAFWRETGIQPYVVLLPYDSTIKTADDRYDFADAYFTDKIADESAILVMYFDSASNNEDGNWEMVKGLMTSAVMDDEATEIFWNYLDRYWYDLTYSVPQALENMFTSTGKTIMTKTTTGMDVLKVVFIGVAIVIAGAVIIVVMKTRRKHKAEENAETERILNTPLESASDQLLDKYSDGK